MTAEVPSTCPTCGTAIPEGATRCPGCGRVFGEANRCPRCHAIAGVLTRGGRPVCAACGGPRELGPGVAVLDGGGGAGASLGAAARRGASLGLRLLAIGAIASGVLGAALASALLPGSLGLVGALVVGVLGVGGGALALRAANRGGGSGGAGAEENAILSLAEARGGELTVTDVARHFGWTTGRADAALTALVDGSRVNLEVDADGILRFQFRELRSAGPRVRVGTEDVGPSADAADEVEVPGDADGAEVRRGEGGPPRSG